MTDPKIYAVERGGALRWIRSEIIIESLYGKDWQKIVDVIPDAFFVNYSTGLNIETPEDHDPYKERGSVSEVDIGII